ncbi:MAG: LamG domain-containing protein [Kiritimatiellae bacterium]|nr:LamG domain-containing protein [Kiritimatiellia bacterium]
MQTKFASALVAAFAALTLTTYAATPVAVWNGNFDKTVPGYTLNLNGNALSADKSAITIDQTYAGVDINFASAQSAMTVLVKYANLESGSNAKIVATSCNMSDYSKDRTGVDLQTNDALRGMWYNGGWSDFDPYEGTIAATGYFAFTYKPGGGTYLHTKEAAGAFPETATWGTSGLHSSNDSIYGATIGGMRSGSINTNWRAASGMEITAIAVFDSVLTVDELNAYSFPTTGRVTVTAADGASVSKLSENLGAVDEAVVVVEDGATLAYDAAFAATKVFFVSAGSITFSAETQPDASYFANVDFTGVQGAVLRSWLEPGVVGFNFNSANGTDTSAALVAGTWQANASDASGTADLFGDGLSTLTWSSANTWAGGTYYFTDGYLDDGANNGNGAEISLSCVPYETYDVVIYASTDNGDGFTSKTVNGTSYTWDSVSASVVEGSATWGKTGLTTAIYGLNAMRIRNLSGPLTIYGKAKNSSYRGGIAAIQIMPPTAEDIVKTYTLTLDGSEASWNAGAWTLDDAKVSAPTAGNVVINATASTTLTIDADVTLSDVTVNGGANIVVNLALGEKTAAEGDTAATYYSFFAGRVAVASGVLQQGSAAVFGTTPVVAVADGATFDLNAFAMNAATAVYVEGAGAGNWPWALTSSGGAFAGTIQNMYLSGNATVGGEYKIVLGADWSASYCYLQNHTLVKTGTGELLVRNLNIPDDGTVIVRGGELHTDQWNCLNKNTSGTVTLKIEADGTVRGTNQQSNPPAATTLDWEGTLNTASRTFIVKSTLSGGGTTANLNFEANATANLKRDLTITSSLTLSGDASFLKDAEATADVTVTPSGTFTTSSSGTITVGAGVVFNLGTARPAASFTVDDEGTLVVQKSSATDVPVVNVSAEPKNVVFKDENGTEIESPKLVYDSEAGTLTFYAGNVWTAADGTAFDTPANWSSGVAPADDENATLQISGDTEITVADAYTLDALVIYGAGEVTFTGAGSVAAANILLENGATLKRDGATISARTGISLASGTVLKLDGVTEAASISGAGAVETYGNVEFTAENTFTGGLTVKSGSLVSSTKTDVGGQIFGKNNYGQATANLSTITVEDGGSLDLANSDGACYAITIAGKGVFDNGVYKGALFNSGAEIPDSHRQMASLALSADAMVKADGANNGWGIVNSSYGAAVLSLNGHTLTVSGAGYFPLVNINTAEGTTTTGTLVIDGATLGLVQRASNLTGVNIVVKGGSKLNSNVAPSAIGSLTFQPSATAAATATNYNLPANFVPALNTSNIDPSGLSVGDMLTLFTAPSGTELTSETITVNAGSRYTTTISDNTVTATVKALAPFLHYDFNGEASAAGAKASDSTYEISELGGSWPAANVNGKNGTAALIKNGNTPWWNSLSADVSAIHAGEMSVVALIRPIAIDGTVRTIWNLGQAGGDGMALVVKDASTLALVSWTGGGAGADIVSVSNIQELAGKWHFVAVVASASGTTLVVDGNEVSTTACVPQGMTQAGQFGAVHGNGSGKGYYGASDDGFLLDDWRVYDAALTTNEVRALKSALLPDPFIIRFR